MNRYRYDPKAPSHLRRLVESARGDDLDVDRRLHVAERLGIATLAVPHVEPRLHRAETPKASWLSGRAVTVTSIALIGGAVGYVGLVRSPPASSPAPRMAAQAIAATVLASAGSEPTTPDPRSLAALPSMRTPSTTSVNVAELPDVPTAHGAPPSLVTAPRVSKPASESTDLRLELVKLDGIREALESAKPRQALQRLDEYAARFPAGKLREEATVLRIEALHAAGEQASAQRLADRLFRDSPNTPYAARVRAALDKASRE